MAWPTLLAATHWYIPASEACTLEIVSTEEPSSGCVKATLPASARVLPANSQDRVGAGTPVDLQANVACCPVTTTTLWGGEVTLGACGTPDLEKTEKLQCSKICFSILFEIGTPSFKDFYFFFVYKCACSPYITPLDNHGLYLGQ